MTDMEDWNEIRECDVGHLIHKAGDPRCQCGEFTLEELRQYYYGGSVATPAQQTS